MSQRRPADIVGSFAWGVKGWMGPMAFGALVILVDQAVQVWARLGIPDFTIPLARFQAAALFAGRIAALAIAMTLTMFAAQGAAHRAWIRLQGLIALTISAALVLALVVLWVDGSQVKTQVPGESMTNFIAQWVRSLVVSLFGAFGFAAFGLRLLTAR